MSILSITNLKVGRDKGVGAYDISGPNTSVSDNLDVTLSSSEKTEIHGEENDISYTAETESLELLLVDMSLSEQYGDSALTLTGVWWAYTVTVLWESSNGGLFTEVATTSLS